MKILKGNDVTINWTITRCVDGSEIDEDFSVAELKVYLIIPLKKIQVEYSITGNVITVFLAGNMQQTGYVSIEAIWCKNDKKNWSRACVNEVLFFTDDPHKVDYICNRHDVNVKTLEVKSAVFGGIGHDGITPHIGDNGHWWIGELDTEIIADMGSRINVVDELPAIGIPGEFYAVFD